MVTEVRENDIPVATVDAPRRRDDVLPEHENYWPDTPEARLLIAQRYDGTYATCHDIGQALKSDKNGFYPSWRIEQIADAMGLYEPKKAELLAKSRAADAAEPRTFRTPSAENTPRHAPVRSIEEAIAVVSNGEQTPTRALLREDLTAIAATPTCRECGETFEPWKSGLGMNRKTCRNCFSQKMIAARARRVHTATADKAEIPAQIITEPITQISQTPAPEPTPEPEESEEALLERTRAFAAWVAAQQQTPEPVYVAGPNFPAFTVALPVVEPDPDPTAPLTFADLPGSDAVFVLLDLLPTDGRWSGKRRYRWLTALTATLDLLIDDDRDEESEALP